MPDSRNHGLDDLDKLVSELHQIAPTRSAPVSSDTPDLVDWLRQVRDLDGSDLLLVASLPPLARVKGHVSRCRGEALSGDDIERAILPIVPSRLRERYRDGEAIDLAFTLKGLGRFRMNLHRERGRPAAAIRALPTRVPRVSDLHFTHDIGLLAELPRGLVLVCGPTGSGKTTTLAALIAEINARHSKHIVTVEDPIEYEHAHGRSAIEQIEIGIDAPDFPTALRAAMRQAPDVIVVGEMRDPETMRIALAAAETGHLVLATIHATDAAAAVARIADGFPVERQNAVRQELAMALAAVLTQTLVQTRSGAMVPVAELLLVSYGARQHIRKNAVQHLNQEITITRKSGSFTLEESLWKLVLGGAIDRADALLRAAHPEELESLLRGS
jgi:twitching motility protein PilT